MTANPPPVITADDIGALRAAVTDLDRLALGELPLDHYVHRVPPVRTGLKSQFGGNPDSRPAMDRLREALGRCGVHEVTPEAYGEWPAKAKIQAD